MRRMGMLGWGLVLLCTACGASRSSVVKEPVEQAAPEAPPPSSEQLRPLIQEVRAPSRRYVDEDLGFELVRRGTPPAGARVGSQGTLGYSLAPSPRPSPGGRGG